MMRQRKIELLAPARNLACGIAAVDHGADAVYIGAQRFGARAAAGNTVEDIARLVEYAHLFRVRVYVTVNTILRDDELADTEQLIWELYRKGVDALIVQDMALLRLNLPPVPLHASTQMDNRTPEKVAFLHRQGFRQVVLARELGLEEIRRIHESCPVPLEVFVHGALCVSYSGRCYVSQHCFGRSANRGECAQFCRLKFDLTDRDGNMIEQGRHWLSLKDMNRSDDLEALLDAGVSSLKIEGRLKDVSYVKNITAYYRKRLDEILHRRPEYARASSGRVTTTFRPQPEKSFNRGFTDYFLRGRKSDIFSFQTPKSLGEEVGTVKEVRGRQMTVAGLKSFSNGDGLCYIDDKGELQGFRVNRVENNKLFLTENISVRPRTRLYRNYDQEFERLLSRPSAERKMALKWLLEDVGRGFALTAEDEDGTRVTQVFDCDKTMAEKPQEENVRRQLSKLGNTPFEVTQTEIKWERDWFIPSSVLAEWRRRTVDTLLSARRATYPLERSVRPSRTKEDSFYAGQSLTYLANVMNGEAAAFYRLAGAHEVAPAFEREEPRDAVLMDCRHCLRYSMGWCPKHSRQRSPYREPYYLVSSDGRRFRLDFDCRDCCMKVYADGKA
ncbi:MAG: U32 family peptidase [Paraprevotella sp.]|nr:U32 family peptidase [Paraprevotella sp.]